MRRLLLPLSCLFLTACTEVASTGASALYNHQSLEKSTQDQYITLRSYQAIDIDSAQFKNTNVNVSTYNKVVLLTGQVNEAWQKAEVEAAVKKIAGVKEVYNQLTVGQVVTSMARVNDTWITAKIKTKLFASTNIDASQIKIITEEGRVFIMGFMRPKEARAAVDAARTTAGVREVVKVISYLNLSRTPQETPEDA